MTIIAVNKDFMNTFNNIDDLILYIARKHIYSIETLETRHWDLLDFHDVAVWSIRDALNESYKAGVTHGQSGKLL